jgi:site-specific DNA recombinase
LLPERYDDGGFSGGTLDRPALQHLLEEIESGGIDCVVVYKVDRLSRSLLDFARLMERFDRQAVSFVAVTQQLNTTTSLGRLTLNVLLSFAQFEREIIGERTRDKMRAARRKGKWIGGVPVLGYDVAAEGGRLVVNEREAEQVREIFELYSQHRSLTAVLEELEQRGWTTKAYWSKRGKHHGGRHFREPTLLRLLTNALYMGKVEHGGEFYEGEQAAIVDGAIWESIQIELRGGCAIRRTVQPKPCALLNGLLYCHLCKRPMSQTIAAAHGRQYRYYACRRPHQGIGAGCPGRAVPAHILEQSVIAQLRLRLGRERQPVWEDSDRETVVRRLVERVTYDGTTGGVQLRLASVDS